MAENDKPIKVSDFRMFTPDGRLRPEFEYLDNEPPEPTSVEPPAAAPAPPAPEPAATETAATDPAFLELVRSLATSAYAALGFLSEPGHPAPADLAGAKRIIEWIAALERKSRQNLSFEEQDILSRALYELRMAFVEAGAPPRGRPKDR